MTTFTPEQLRRFAELGGWRHEPDGLWIPPNDDHFNRPLPDFPSVLAACFEVLEHFCSPASDGGFHKGFGLTKYCEGSSFYYTCWIGLRLLLPHADTKQSAIIAAVLAASEKQS